MSNNFQAISLSYKNAPLNIREAVALSEVQIKALYLSFKDILGLSEAIAISTCNRTEVYFRSEKNVTSEMISLIATQSALKAADIRPYFIEFGVEEEALEHLFSVSLGLEAQILGDQQISNQIKTAYQWSVDADMAGPFLHRVMHSVFYANKRVVQETAFRDGAASTSYISVDILQSIFPVLSSPRILVLGLGEIGLDLVKTLFERGIRNVSLTTRDYKKAQMWAEEFEYTALRLDEAKAGLTDFDIIISSLRVDKPFIIAEDFTGRHIFTYLFDLSIPRSIAPDLDHKQGVVLYGLDEIQKRTDSTLASRRAAIPKVQDIIHKSVSEIDVWSKELMVSPTIQKLKGALENIRQEEMARYLKGMNKSEVEIVEKITSSMMQKIIKLPVLQLKAACKRGEAETLIDVLNDLFNLEKVGNVENI